jgi:acyl dehydratase
MSIDIDRVLGAEFPERSDSWTQDDVILYHLALGAGVPPTDSNELEYTYERNLKVLPSFGVMAASQSLLVMFGLPGMDVDLGKVLHGEQDLVVHDVLPASGKVRIRARVADIYDKGKAALVVLETITTSEDDGRALCTNRFSLFFRGDGGFGGESGPAAENDAPDRPPDRVVECPTLPQQGLLYRLCGDKNPLHVDPAFAQRAGFERPILHGLCSYGIVCKAVVDAAFAGDVSRVGRYTARFAGVVLPGETIEVSIWREEDRIIIAAQSRDRGSAVLSNAAIVPR